MENNVDFGHFQHFSNFFFIIFMANYPFENITKGLPVGMGG